MNNSTKHPSFLKIAASLMLETVPSYANKIYYSMGFLSMTAFLVLLVSGVVLVVNGPNWWLTNSFGVYVRSVHLWASEAFVFFILLHLLVVFFTSGFKPPRRLTWILGALMFFLVVVEAEFGYGLRGDFSSQWRSLQAADLYNGSGLGLFINNLNFSQIYGIHIIIIPAIIVVLLFFHYLLIKVRGIAAPYRSEVSYSVVKANHTILFLRGTGLIVLILILGFFFKSPTILPITIQGVASEDPSLVGKTLMEEFNRSSGTATYLDNIDPYKFDTRQVYVGNPYQVYLKVTKGINKLTIFDKTSVSQKDQYIKGSLDYFAKGGQPNISPINSNPLIPVISSLVVMSQSGLYEANLRTSLSSGYNPTYVTRFLADTGVLEEKATSLGITTNQYGMIHEESSSMPLGAWWLTPIGVLDHTLLANDPNQDRDGAEIIGLLLLFMIAFPYIPLLNRIPDWTRVYKLIWRG